MTVCGIVGLHLKNTSMHGELGRLVTPMLDCMATRGPDSAGLAIYKEAVPEGRSRYSIRVEGFESTSAAEQQSTSIDAVVSQIADGVGKVLNDEVSIERVRPDGAVLVAKDDVAEFARAMVEVEPRAVLQGTGRQMEIVKAVGAPAEVCRRYDIASREGFQAVGHTRMATESAVTIDHSHPFAPYPDLGVVHNGSFSNHATVRRRLQDEGITFETDNDTEVCARLIGHELSNGASLSQALKEVGNEMDGFYTLLVSHSSGFAVVRDSIACKPLVVAEHDDYVAVTSEYIAMASLPGIESARVFEPKPEEIYAWSR